MIERVVRAVAIGVVVLGVSATVAAATTFESRSVSVTKTTGSGVRVDLDGKVSSKSTSCHGGVPVRLERLRANGTWATIRSAQTKPKGAFSWTIVGFKAKARVVVPKVSKSGLVCAPVILGFDRGYLSP
jgi:hypothetical protein